MLHSCALGGAKPAPKNRSRTRVPPVPSVGLRRGSISARTDTRGGHASRRLLDRSTPGTHVCPRCGLMGLRAGPVRTPTDRPPAPGAHTGHGRDTGVTPERHHRCLTEYPSGTRSCPAAPRRASQGRRGVTIASALRLSRGRAGHRCDHGASAVRRLFRARENPRNRLRRQRGACRSRMPWTRCRGSVTDSPADAGRAGGRKSQSPGHTPCVRSPRAFSEPARYPVVAAPAAPWRRESAAYGCCDNVPWRSRRRVGAAVQQGAVRDSQLGPSGAAPTRAVFLSHRPRGTAQAAAMTTRGDARRGVRTGPWGTGPAPDRRRRGSVISPACDEVREGAGTRDGDTGGKGAAQVSPVAWANATPTVR
jgi:hypothetical protein